MFWSYHFYMQDSEWWTVHFDIWPANFMTLKASWFDHDHVFWNVRGPDSTIWNLCRTSVFPFYRTSLGANRNRNDHFRQREQKMDPLRNQGSFPIYDPLDQKIHVSANQNRHHRQLTESWEEMYQEDRRGWDHQYLKWSFDFWMIGFNFRKKDLTVTIFIDPIVV